MLKRFIALVFLCGLNLGLLGSASAAFHLYRINELYSNSDGSIQFIELTVGGFNDEYFWAGQSITVSRSGQPTHSFTFPGNLPLSATTPNTANTSVLIATQGFADLGIVTPNYVIPAGFLYTGGGTINFGSGADVLVYSALPLDGILSRNRDGSNGVNSPKNFAGVTGTIPGFSLSVTTAGTGSGTVTSDPSGINCGATCSANFGQNNPITLTATPAGGSVFAGWSGDCTGTGSCTVLMTGAKSVTATFNPPPDTAPDPFSFTPQTGVPVNTLLASNSITVLGINTATAISVAGGEYSVNGGPFTAAAGTVMNGDTVRVRLNSASTPSTTTSATLTIGGVSAAFNVTTSAAPVLSLLLISGPTVVSENATASYAASALFSDGTIVAVTPSWSSSDSASAAIDAGGIVAAGAVAASTPVTLGASYTAGAQTATASFTITVADSGDTLPSYSPVLDPGFNILGNSLNGTLNVFAAFGNITSPVANVTEWVVSVWKWDAANNRWAFYSPQLTIAQLLSFTAASGYAVLSAVQPGEGYWVNTAAPITLTVPAGAGVGASFSAFSALVPGFNLIAIADVLTPSQFNVAVSEVTPAPGVVPQNFVSLWTWNTANQRWFFYSPLLEASGGLAAVKSYADSQKYLHFEDFGKTLGLGVGFWVNK